MNEFLRMLGVGQESSRTRRFADDAKVIIHGIPHKPQHSATNGVAFKRMDETNASVFFIQAEIQGLYDLKAIEVVPKFYAEREAKKKTDGFTSLAALPIKRSEPILKKEMWARAAIQAEEENRIEREEARRAGQKLPQKFSAKSSAALDREMPNLRAKLEKRMNELFAGASTYKNRQVLVTPSGRTVAGWVSKIQANALDPLSLYDNYPTRRDEYFEPDVLVYLHKALKTALSNVRPDLTLRHIDMSREIEQENERRSNATPSEPLLVKPSYECLRKRWLRIPESVRDAARLGKEAAKAKWSAVNKGQEILRPLELVQMDEYKTNLKTLYVLSGKWETLTKEERKRVKRVRLWITGAIDVATRCFVGLKVHIQAPSLKTALTTLEMTTIDKTSIARAAGCETPWDMYGSLEELGVDSAAWFSRRPMRVAVNDLGASLFLPASGDASMRGTIERVFNTFGHMLLAYFHGQTFGSVDERGDYESDKLASGAIDVISNCVIRFVVDGYHNKPHDGLHGATPKQTWVRLENQWGVLPEPTGELRRNLFGTIFSATLGRHGIQKLGLPYNSRQLHNLFKGKAGTVVICRLDRQDIGEISAWVNGGWVKVPCLYPELKGVSLAKWVAVGQHLRLFNREQAATSRKVFADTMYYLEQQAEMSRISAELDSPIVDEEVLARIDRALDRGFKFFDDDTAPVESIPFDGEWRPSNDFYAIMGISPVMYVKPPEAKAAEDATRPGTDPVAKSKRSAPSTRSATASKSTVAVIEPKAAPEGFSNLFDKGQK